MMSGSRILAVDDQPIVLDLLREILAPAGYEFLEATDGEAGLRVMREAKPDLAIIDLAMPGMDGFELLRRIRAETSIPVLVLTGCATLKDVLEEHHGEAPDSFLQKPIQPKRLLEVIHYHLGAVSPW
jgi:CheY-like chemotaxis protein